MEVALIRPDESLELVERGDVVIGHEFLPRDVGVDEDIIASAKDVLINGHQSVVAVVHHQVIQLSEVPNCRLEALQACLRTATVALNLLAHGGVNQVFPH